MNLWWKDWQHFGQSIGWETASERVPSLGFIPSLQYQNFRMVGLGPENPPDPDTFVPWWEEAGKPWVIWFDQWEQAPEVVQSKMKHVVGASIRVPARLCRWGEISAEEYRSFLLHHHVFGFARAKHRYGLYLPEKYRRIIPEVNWPRSSGPLLVSVSGFSEGAWWERPTGRSFSMEWIRFATRPFLHVVGGWQKMLHHVAITHQPGDIMSYSDRGWQGSQGGLASLGFQCEEILSPMRFCWDKHRGRRVVAADGPIFNVGTEKWIKYFPPLSSC